MSVPRSAAGPGSDSMRGIAPPAPARPAFARRHFSLASLALGTVPARNGDVPRTESLAARSLRAEGPGFDEPHVGFSSGHGVPLR